MSSSFFVCTKCGHVGKAKTLAKGSVITEFIFWFSAFVLLLTFWPFIILAFAYSLYRLFSKYKGCSKCRSRDIIPVDTPKGQEMLNKNSSN